MRKTTEISSFRNALPFWICLSSLPVVAVSAYLGGWWLLLTLFYTWIFIGIYDAFEGTYDGNSDADVPDSMLFWYRLITMIWAPIQFILIYGCIYFAVNNNSYTGLEKATLMASVGILSGSVGIVFAHELMHQRPKVERHLADVLMAMALYGHFRSEHLKVHHRYVGTPRDSVTARYNEGFHRFFPRAVIGSLKSAWHAEASQLTRSGKSSLDRSNPFWKYLILQILFLGIAYAVGGWAGVGLFAIQAGVAIWQLELINYIEHYGLTREHLGDGKYEHCKPHHSWNAAHRVSNYFLINLQRHSDHHYKPDRRFPLLQTYGADEAPQLPYGYALMGISAMIPPLWRRRMNPRVREWRRRFYPEITDWSAYNKGRNPMPK